MIKKDISPHINVGNIKMSKMDKNILIKKPTAYITCKHKCKNPQLKYLQI